MLPVAVRLLNVGETCEIVRGKRNESFNVGTMVYLRFYMIK